MHHYPYDGYRDVVENLICKLHTAKQQECWASYKTKKRSFFGKRALHVFYEILDLEIFKIDEMTFNWYFTLSLQLT